MGKLTLPLPALRVSRGVIIATLLWVEALLTEHLCSSRSSWLPPLQLLDLFFRQEKFLLENSVPPKVLLRRMSALRK